MDYNKIKKYISAARLVRYEQVCNNDQQKVLKLYQANLRLSQSFYPLLSLFEVVLRNAINEELVTHFNDADWLTNQINGFMSHPSLTYLQPLTGQTVHNHYLKKAVESIIKRNQPPNLPQVQVPQGRIIADLSFGFWTELFEKIHYQNLNGSPIQIFTNRTPGLNRNMVNQKLNRIRRFRNRISHHEPIIFAKGQQGQTIFSLIQVNEIYNDIYDIFTWLDLDFNKWTKKINHVSFEIQRTEYVYNNYPELKYYLKRVQLGWQLYRNKYLKK